MGIAKFAFLFKVKSESFLLITSDYGDIWQKTSLKWRIKQSHHFACKHGCNKTVFFNYLLSPKGGPTAFKIWLRKDWKRKNSVQKFSERRLTLY